MEASVVVLGLLERSNTGKTIWLWFLVHERLMQGPPLHPDPAGSSTREVKLNVLEDKLE